MSMLGQTPELALNLLLKIVEGMVTPHTHAKLRVNVYMEVEEATSDSGREP